MARQLAVVMGKDDVEQKGLTLRDAANGIQIKDQISYEHAADFLTEVKTKMKEVEAAMDPQCKAAYDSWQTALTQKKRYLAPFLEAETIVKKGMGAYQLEQRRMAEEAERRAREEAAKQEEKERQALLKKAAKCKNEDRAAELEAQAGMVFVPVVAPVHEVTKAEGVSAVSDFDIEIHDMKAFIRALADGKIMIDPAEIFTVKIAPIKQYIKLTKTTNIPGVSITEKMVIAAKGRK